MFNGQASNASRGYCLCDNISCDTFLCAASTRKLYERKLQKVLDEPPSDSPTVTEAVPEITALADTNQNGNTHTDQYSDKEDGKILNMYTLHLLLSLVLFTWSLK